MLDFTFFPYVALVVKNLSARQVLHHSTVIDKCFLIMAVALDLDIRDTGLTPWRRAWQPTPVFLSGESHRQRNLAGYSPQGCKGSDTTKVT